MSPVREPNRCDGCAAAWKYRTAAGGQWCADCYVRQLLDLLHEIRMQATRRNRASGLKMYLVVDLKRIERLAGHELRLND